MQVGEFSCPIPVNHKKILAASAALATEMSEKPSILGFFTLIFRKTTKCQIYQHLEIIYIRWNSVFKGAISTRPNDCVPGLETLAACSGAILPCIYVQSGLFYGKTCQAYMWDRVTHKVSKVSFPHSGWF